MVSTLSDFGKLPGIFFRFRLRFWKNITFSENFLFVSIQSSKKLNLYLHVYFIQTKNESKGFKKIFFHVLNLESHMMKKIIHIRGHFFGSVFKKSGMPYSEDACAYKFEKLTVHCHYLVFIIRLSPNNEKVFTKLLRIIIKNVK